MSHKIEQYISDFIYMHVYMRVCARAEKEGKQPFEPKSVSEQDSVLWGGWDEYENLRTKMSDAML